MYPLGVLFGLGFDTSSEIALLGISSIHGAAGTSIWLIMIFPILFTSGMCLLDTLDGALMLTLYLQPAQLAEEVELLKGDDTEEEERGADGERAAAAETTTTVFIEDDGSPDNDNIMSSRPPHTKDPLPYLYYSTLLTLLTLLVAVFIGTLQLLSLVSNVAKPTPTGRFWDGVAFLGDSYDIVGGIICGVFAVVGVVGWVGWRSFRGWVDRYRERKGLVAVVGDGREDRIGDETV